MREVEATGKNIEQAIQNALLELKASREDVDIKILSEGGFLKKAKVKVSISEDAIEKYEKKEAFKKTIIDEEIEKEEKKDEEEFAEKFIKAKIKETEKAEKAESKQEKKEQKEEVKETKKHKDSVEKKYTAQEFVDGVLKSLELQGNLEKVENDRADYYLLTGENLNDLIGHHGDCLNALSYLMSLVCKTETKSRLVLDIENYRAKREESLKALAKRTADKVAKTKRYYKFEPMDPAERRIIHLALQDDERVTTLSKGEEPHRYLMVFPKEYDER